MKTFPLVCVLALAAASASAQSTITLEDFDLGDDTGEPGPVAADQGGDPGMTTCLTDGVGCDDGAAKAGVGFSIDDVVNLGIVDREEVETDRPSADGQVASTADPLPSIDLEVLFDTASHDIRADQIPQLARLSDTLRSSDFSTFTLVFIGHTDAKGSSDYNRSLSQRRAESVADFVAMSADVPKSRVRSVGMGFTQLASPGDPYSEKNRRVQLVLVPRK